MEVANDDTLWLDVDNTDAELAASISAANARLAQRPSPQRRVAKLGIALLAAGFAVWRFSQAGVRLTKEDFLPFCYVLLPLAAVFIFSQHYKRRLIRHISHQFQVGIAEQGFWTRSENGHQFFHWHTLEGIERRSDAIVLHLRGFRVLWIPERCFAAATTCADWLARLEALSGHQAAGLPPRAHKIPERRGLAALRDLAANLWSGVLSLLLRRSALSYQRGSILQIVLVTAAGILFGVVQDMAQLGLDGQVYWFGLPVQFASLLCALTSAWLVANCSTHPDRIPAATLAVLTPMLAMRLIYAALTQFHSHIHSIPGLSIVAWLSFFWAVIAAAVALARTLELEPDQRVAAILGAVFVAAVPYLLDAQQIRLWTPNYDDSPEAEETDDKTASPAKEAVLYAQPALLEQSLNTLKKGRPGVPELYLLAVGGYGEQDVFLREVRSVAQLFQERFATAGHSVVLVNNPATVLEQPIASTIALRESLKAIGDKMNRDEDVLFLFMTSHGAADYKFSLNLWPYQFDELTPESLRSMLDDARIKNRVIVVSACYSGGFVKPLANDNTLVMSASRADRNSHGCSHEADWTFFGKAYFDEALRQTRSFEQAFSLAKAAVSKRETAEELEHSEPQIASGTTIQAQLRKLEMALNAQKSP